MKISGSILGIKDDIAKIKKFNDTSIDYIHLDVMDGKFVSNESLSYDFVKTFSTELNKPLDVHLMVEDVTSYINDFIKLKPEMITFHVETKDVLKNIDLVKKNNIKVGLAINPFTNLDELNPYLDKIDLILVMSVEPGYGGQEFIESTYERINELKKSNCLISVDGGINDENIKKLNTDIAVVGNFITSKDDFENQIRKLVIE